MAAEGLASTASEVDTSREVYVARNFRHNFILMLLDAVSFPFGISFVSVITILPLFVREMTDSTLAVGLVPAITNLGVLLPPLFIANYIERQQFQKWYLFWVACLERAPFLVLAFLIPWLGRVSPTTLLVVFFVALTIHNFAMGFNMPSYFNLYAKVIPANRRGTMWGVGGAIGGLLALGGAQLSGYLLDRYGFPDAYALSFLVAFVILTLGIIGFRYVRELPTTDNPPPIPSLQYVRQSPSVLRRDPQFGTFVLSQVLYSFAYMAPAFYTVYALDHFGADPRTVALFTTVLMGTNTVANLLLGLLADRHGNKVVLQLGMLLAVAAPLLTVLAPSLGWMYAVFVLHSFAHAGSDIGGFNLPLEFAPRPQVPTYSAVNMTAVAPFRALAPVLGGVLAALSYPLVFWIAAGASIISLALLSWKVHEPRHRTPPASMEALT
ncbi:MAG: MFS transporter [Chloroflexota bacterium]|nr:MFS transporter [Chloroflexota bacterium]